jgi:single-strand DNA-binding protein
VFNESTFSVVGYVATIPRPSETPAGVPTLDMRLAWTPRKQDRSTGSWTDEPSCFATVKCYRKLAENALMSVHKGDPVVVTGTLRIREFDGKDGGRRTVVEVNAISIGHDLSRGVATFQRLRPATKHVPADSPEMASYPPWARRALGGQPSPVEPGQTEAGQAQPDAIDPDDDGGPADGEPQKSFETEGELASDQMAEPEAVLEPV